MRILRKREVLTMLGVSYATLNRMMKAGTAPPHIELNTRRIGWLESDVLQWIEQRRVHPHSVLKKTLTEILSQL
jgi:prophage regulatory protein